MKYLFYSLFVLLHAQQLFAQTEFSQENATNLLKVLSVEIGPRPMGSPAEQRAQQFAVEKFKEYGCDTSYIMKMEYSTRANTTSGIAIGIKRGTTKRIILLGGHIDSAGPEIPGADDDGSGAATVMELARILAKRQMQSTIVFCCWGGEERGLEGSQYFVDHFENLDDITLMLQVDMANGLGIIELDPDTHLRSAPKWLVRAAVEEFDKLGYKNLRYPTHFFSINYNALPQGSGSDHESFLDKGIPAIDFSTDVSKPIHTPRDNFENFDPRGLKRTGDVFLKLVERFDGGTPTRETERYWLYLIGSTPIFVPIWELWAFIFLTLIITVVTFISVRKRRESPSLPDRIHWSGIKMFLLVIIIVASGWLSSDLISVIKGIRFPWFVSIPLYYLFAAIAMLAGCWIAIGLGRKFHLSLCPYVFYKRSVIILIIFLIILGCFAVKLTVEPTVALLLVSLALLVRSPLLKLVFVALSPWWILRLIFSEWDGLVLHSLSESVPFGTGSYILYNVLFILFFSLYLLPFFYAVTAVFRDSPSLHTIVNIVRSKWTLALSLAAFIVLGAYLLTIPSYNQLWYRNVRIMQSVDLSKHTTDVNLSSSDYLSGVRLKHGNTDTLFTSRTLFSKIIPRAPLDTTWLRVQRVENKKQSGDSTHYDIDLTLFAKMRPFTVTVTYSSGEKEIRSFDTHWKYRSVNKEKYIDWYSFPDTTLSIPVKFDIVGKDSVKEKIDVVFDALAYPMECERELTYFTPRTRYVDGWVYRR